MKTVLITGSEGNIGRYIVAALRRRYPDWTLLRVGRGVADGVRFDPDTHKYEGDLRDPSLMGRITRDHRVDVLVHAASTSYSHGGYRANPYDVLDGDCRMTLNVLRHAASFGKIVFLSSALAYEHAGTPDLTEELTSRIPAPTSSYGVAKYLGEQAVQLASRQTGVPYTIWRPFNVVSPLEPTEGEGRHVFVDFFRRLFIDRVGEFHVLGSGQQVRCFIWVEEVAECIAETLEVSKTDNEIINLARREPITLLGLKDLLVSIGREQGALPAEYDPPVRADGTFSGVEAEARVPSTAKLLALTGWESRTTVRDCFVRFVTDKLRGPRSLHGH